MRDTRRTANACIVKLETASLLISEVEEHYRWNENADHFDGIQDLIGYLIEFIAQDDAGRKLSDLLSRLTSNDTITPKNDIRYGETWLSTE